MSAERVRTLLLRGDNLLKSGRSDRLPRALEAFEEALEAADEAKLRELVERRIATLRELMDANA